MKESQKKIHEKHKVIAFVVLVLFCICAGFTSYIIWDGQNDIDSKISFCEKHIRTVIKLSEKNSADKYRDQIIRLLAIKTAPIKEDIIKAFERQDREELLQLSKPFYNMFKKEDDGFNSFAWILPDNRVFLRLHKPEMFGDDLSAIRPDIVQANRDLQQNSGYTTAYTGLSYRIVQPVIYQGRHLGTLQFGLADSYIIDTIQKQLGLAVAQVISSDRLHEIRFSKMAYCSDNSFRAQSSDHDIALIKSASPPVDWKLDRQETTIHGREYIVSKVLELPNYNGETEGWIFALFDISEAAARMRNSVIKAIAISITLLLLSSFMISRSYNNLIDHLENQVAEHTQKLTESNIALASALKKQKQTEEQLAASLNEKVVLLREIHHRVKNNMQVIVSLLRIHARRITDPQVEKVFEECRDRINAMSLIHESLYESEDLANIDFKIYLEKLCHNLRLAYGLRGKKIALTVEQCNVALNIDQGIAIGMVVTELISNAFKHAFPLGRGGQVSISLVELDRDRVKMVVKDNGKGIPSQIDIMNAPSLGLQLAVAAVTHELGGSIEVDRDGGTQFTIHFKYKKR